jgi:hypothetical protein
MAIRRFDTEAGWYGKLGRGARHIEAGRAVAAQPERVACKARQAQAAPASSECV